MAKELEKAETDLLPVWQRIAWMAGIWSASVALMALVSWLIGHWFVG